MSRMPPSNWNNRFSGFPPQGFWPPQRPRRRRVRWKLRRIWLVLPLIGLACLVFVWLISHLDFDLDFDFDFDLDRCLSDFGINDTEAFTNLLIFGLILIGIATFLRILRGSRKMGTDMNNTRVSFTRHQVPRENLEDDFGLAKILLPLFGDIIVTILVLCDGVGGNVDGDVAEQLGGALIGSSIAASLVIANRDIVQIPEDIMRILVKSLEQANEYIPQQAFQQHSLKGMATTIVSELIIKDQMYVAWAGDLRCYLYRHGKLRQVTVDHSEAQWLVDTGVLDTQFHTLSHTINHYLGQPQEFQPDSTVRHIRPKAIEH